MTSKQSLGNAVTPATNRLFEVDQDSPLLGKAESQSAITTKLLFLAKQTQPDILTTVAFLTTRVQAPTKTDKEKHTQVIKYLRFTPKLDLTLQLGNFHIIKCNTDGAFAVHLDMKSHTGGLVTMGKGACYASSTRHKLNTKSIT